MVVARDVENVAWPAACRRSFARQPREHERVEPLGHTGKYQIVLYERVHVRLGRPMAVVIFESVIPELVTGIHSVACSGVRG